MWMGVYVPTEMAFEKNGVYGEESAIEISHDRCSFAVDKNGRKMQRGILLLSCLESEYKLLGNQFDEQ
jgi:hypothetical protein